MFPYGAPVKAIVGAIAGLRASASGAADDLGLFNAQGGYVVAPADANAIAFSRSTDQVRGMGWGAQAAQRRWRHLLCGHSGT